jgi:addiction module HigA family antidote
LELPVSRPIDREPSHPGELFAEILEDHARLSVAEAAIRMKVSRQSLYAVLKGDSAVTADMALRFGRLVDGNPMLYVHMQAQRDVWLAQRRLRETLSEIEPVPAE